MVNNEINELELGFHVPLIAALSAIYYLPMYTSISVKGCGGLNAQRPTTLKQFRNLINEWTRNRSKVEETV